MTEPPDERPAPPPWEHDPDTDWRRMVAVSTATVITVVTIIVLVENVARQPVLITSLASSTFLLYYQPLHRMNRFWPVVGGHLIAERSASPPANSSARKSPLLPCAITACVAVLAVLLRIVHPPAIGTSAVFAYRPDDVSAPSHVLAYPPGRRRAGSGLPVR